MPQYTNDHFPEAAVRHFVDGKILQDADRADNAMCHYAFSAECAMKAIYEQICANRGYRLNHNVEEAWRDMQQYHAALQILDAKAGTLLGSRRIPEELFDGHPGRRYARDKGYTEGEMQGAGIFAEFLVRKLVSEVLNGTMQS
ncbi:MAG: hypothetical protein HFI88_03820 [Lachnospiraceae bacterium]|nr:hypothetical protein [Lachnospiraceae bacterium]